MVDPGCGARCAIRDTGAPGERRYHLTVTVFGEPDPVAVSGRGRLGRHDALLANGPLARLFLGVLDALDYWVM